MPNFIRGLFPLLTLISLIACQSPSRGPEGAGPVPAPLLSGKVELDAAVKAQADPLAVLFIIARNEQGQIVAVKKLLPPFQWPVDFSLGEADVMIAGTELSGKLKLTARLDKDGNANPAQSGDILGKTEQEWVSRGGREISLKLKEAVP
ncbi:MAG TPA: hypothetical protein VFW62_00365 [bacterium]|nr:hypothetical protein [bacterium]